MGAVCTFWNPGFIFFTKTFQIGGKWMELTLTQHVKGILLFNFIKNPKFSLCFGHFLVCLDTFVGLDENCSQSGQNTRKTLDFC